VPVFAVQFPIYRLSLIGVGVALALFLWLLIERTRIGAIIRAGVADAEMVSALDFEILILTLVVVVVGGLGTLKGAFFGSLLIGMADTFGKAFLPEFTLFLIFAVMAVVLLLRPSGLFGLEGA